MTASHSHPLTVGSAAEAEAEAGGAGAGAGAGAARTGAKPVITTTRAPFYLSVAAHTDIGKVREKNEDAFVVTDLSGLRALLHEIPHARFDVGERGVLLAVSDGMGGAEAGEVASALVIETLMRAMAAATKDGSTNNVGTVPRDALMTSAIRKAHSAVWDVSKRSAKRMGATLTAVFVHAGQAYIAEVGDSRAYLIRGGDIVQLTHDQSMVQLLVDNGIMAPGDVAQSPIRNVILQAMGHQPDVKIALARLELRHCDCLVLCSDGLTTLVHDEEIRDMVLSSGRPEIAARELINLANDRGGKDNITVIVAGVGGSLTIPDADERITDTFEILAPYEPEPTPIPMPPAPSTVTKS